MVTHHEKQVTRNPLADPGPGVRVQDGGWWAPMLKVHWLSTGVLWDEAREKLGKHWGAAPWTSVGSYALITPVSVRASVFTGRRLLLASAAVTLQWRQGSHGNGGPNPGSREKDRPHHPAIHAGSPEPSDAVLQEPCSPGSWKPNLVNEHLPSALKR